MDDRQTMERIAGGDEAALQALLRRFGPLIRYILRPILTDERDREECFADISLRIWQNAAGFDSEKGSLNSWLTALSRNAALNRARGQRQSDTPLEDSDAHGHSAEEELLRRERAPGCVPSSRRCRCRSAIFSIENTTTASPPPKWPPSWA